MNSSESRPGSHHEKDKMTSPLCLPDLPLPTPPPMANIMMTSRFDLNTRGGCGYRRILSSRSTEFRSPILGRTQAFKQVNQPQCQMSDRPLLRHYESLTDGLGLSPLPRHRNFEDLTKRLEDFDEFRSSRTLPPKSKYLSRDSVLSQELEEVNNLSHEIQNKFSEVYQPEFSPDYQTVFYNEHYMSDIDENEEIKQFSFGYKTPERRYSDNSEKRLQITNEANTNYNTLPSLSSLKCARNQVNVFGSTSSMKSSDFYATSPMFTRKDFHEPFPRILKHPHRPVVKQAKIR